MDMTMNSPFAMLSERLRLSFRSVAVAAVVGFVVASPIITISSPVLAQAASSGDAVTMLNARIDTLESLVRDLTGRVEETQYKNQQLQKRIDQLMGDVDFRFQRLEKGNAAVPGADGANVAAPQTNTQAPQLQPPVQSSQGAIQLHPPAGAQPQQQTQQGQPQQQGQAGVLGYLGGSQGQQPQTQQSQSQQALGQQQSGRSAPPAASTSAASPEESYRQAFELIRVGDYAAAEKALSSFVQANPNHELAGNAQYWLGETYYVRGDFKSAAVAFLDGYRKYPKNTKAPDNLLKLGLAMNQLGKSQEACAAFKKMSSEYPKAPDAVAKRASQESARLSCK